VLSSGSPAPGRLPESLRPRRPSLPFEVPFVRSALLGGDGDRELDIQERFAKSAKDSTVFDLSKRAACGSSGTSPTLSLTRDLGRSFWAARTLGLDFELGSHERGRSIIDLVRPDRSSSATMAAGGGVSALISTAFSCTTGRRGGFLSLSNLRADSKSARSNDGTSKAGRLGSSLELFARCNAWGFAGGNGWGKADNRSGVECER